MIRIFRFAWLAICLVIFAGPLFQLSAEAFHVEADVWDHLRDNLLVPGFFETLMFAFGCGITGLLIGGTWALLSMFLPRIAPLFHFSMAILLSLPTYVMGYLYLSFLDYSGPLQIFLVNNFGDGSRFEPRSLWAAVLTYSLSTSPYVYFSVRAGYSQELRRLLEASQSLGAGLRKSFWRILWPGLAPWALGGASLITLEAAADFGVVDIFGINTLSRVLYRSWGSLFSFGGASRISLVLFAVCILILLIVSYLAQPTLQKAEQSSNLDLSQIFPLGIPLKTLCYLLFALGIFIFNLIPLTLLFKYAKVSLWRELPWWESMMSSLKISLLSALVVGSMMAILYFLWSRPTERSSNFRGLLDIFTIGYGLPGTLLAVGFYLFTSQILGGSQLSSSVGILLALLVLLYFTKFSGLMLKGLRSREKDLPNDLFEAASSLGSPAKSFCRIELPLFSPALLLGFFLLFLEVIKELPAALMIKPFIHPSLALRIHQYASESDWERASIYSLVLIGLIAVTMMAVKLVTIVAAKGRRV